MNDRIKTILKPVASLKLTVVLFALALLLVFAGTLAQVDEGIWTVLGKYFRSFFVWIPLQVFLPRPQPGEAGVPGAIPYPGGFVIGGLLMVNLLAAHTIRFKLTWKRSGIFMIHAGIILMLVGELVTALYAVEGNMSIDEGHSSNFVENLHRMELAIIDPSDARTDDVVVIPESILRRAKDVIDDPRLPFNVQVLSYMTNSALVNPNEAPGGNPANAGDGLTVVAVQRPEISGTDPNQAVDAASAYVRFTDRQSGQALGTYLVSLFLSSQDRPQKVSAGDKTYNVDLRFKRMYKPFTLHLVDFRHEVYPGTEIPKDFSSVVRLVDPSQNEDRQVRIWMNHPLRYAGQTFYQSAFKPDDSGTILQVVRNPGWLLPYISCVVVAGGMLVHFGMHLIGFLRRIA